MMLSPFELSVPSDARYRVLAPEVAAKYAALAGCAEADAHAVLEDVERAAADVADAGGNVVISFGASNRELHVTLTCGSRSVTVRRTLPVAK